MNKFLKTLKATVISLIVAFLMLILIIGSIYLFGKEKIMLATFMIETIAPSNVDNTDIKPVLENGILVNFPTYGTKYATLKIDSIGVNLPVYFGASYSILKSGIAHDDNSYFPGQGGSVIMAGHNFKNFLAKLPDVKNGDIIEVNTTYGDFKYQVSNSKIVKETAIDEVPIQEENEILMLYTCWPINNIGHASERYVVYADLMQ